MTIIRKWLNKEFTEDNIHKVDEVCGVLLFLTEDGYINFVGSSSNLYFALMFNFKNGEIPAKKFTAYQTQDLSLAIDLAERLNEKYEPYYNYFNPSDFDDISRLDDEKPKDLKRKLEKNP